MKKILLTVVAVLLMLSLLSGCDGTQTKPVTADPVTPPVAEETLKTAYAQQIERYYMAILEQWDESACFDHEMSALVVYYYEGNALDNVGVEQR